MVEIPFSATQLTAAQTSQQSRPPEVKPPQLMRAMAALPARFREPRPAGTLPTEALVFREAQITEAPTVDFGSANLTVTLLVRVVALLFMAAGRMVKVPA
jgi:hypothetical protein